MYISLLLMASLLALSAETVDHNVKPGETLYSIARHYNIPLELVVAWNEITDPSFLEEGTSITIPDIYTVAKGDTLYSIAKARGIALDELKRLNNLRDNSIMQGDLLFIPQVYQGSVTNDTPSNDTLVSSTLTPQYSDKNTQTRQVSQPSPSVNQFLLSNRLLPVRGKVSRRSGKLPGIVIESQLGSEVQAVSDGTVIYAGPHSSFGNVVLIQSSSSYIYVYAGQADILVSVGDSINPGDPIGTVGVSPELNTPALYFSIWKDSRFIDVQYNTQ